MILGATGHQDLGDAASAAWVRDAVVNEIAGRQVTSGITCLAAGADQLIASLLRAAQIPFDVVLPCAGYEEAFTDDAARANYRTLLAGARRVHQLPYAAPTEEAFYAGGRYIVENCDLLVAIWNGLSARGLGGTADVVALAIAAGRPWVHINPRTRSIQG